MATKIEEKTKKYSKETNKGYAGMLGCFDYMMKTCNRTDEKEVAAKRQERENKLKQAHNNMGPKGKEMVECAFQEEMEKAKDSLAELTRNGDYVNKMKCKMCIDELNRLGMVLGIENLEKNNSKNNFNESSENSEKTKNSSSIESLSEAASEMENVNCYCNTCCLIA